MDRAHLLVVPFMQRFELINLSVVPTHRFIHSFTSICIAMGMVVILVQGFDILAALDAKFSKDDVAFFLKLSGTADDRQSPSTPDEGDNVKFRLFVSDDGIAGNVLTLTEAGLRTESYLEELLPRKVRPPVLGRVLTKKVARQTPIVRTVVYQIFDHAVPSSSKPLGRKFTCVHVYAVFRDEVVYDRCSPTSSDTSTCLVDLVLPPSWWPKTSVSLETSSSSSLSSTSFTNGATKKRPKLVVKIGLSTFIVADPLCDSIKTWYNPKTIVADQFLKNLQIIGDVELEQHSKISVLSVNDAVHLIVPNIEFYPSTMFTVPIILQSAASTVSTSGKDDNVVTTSFVLRCRCTQPLYVAGVKDLSDSDWTVSSSINAADNSITVTAQLDKTATRNDTQAEEVFVALFGVSTSNVLSETSAELVWEFSEETESIVSLSETYSSQKISMQVGGGDQQLPKASLLTHPSGVKTRFNVKKDTLVDLIAVGKSQLINTASLTGSQASLPLKVLTVTRSGIITDVTLMSSCFTMESSAIKVTPSCTAVYVDGSEVRGSINATIHVEYGDLKSLSHFTVWYPEFPVEIFLDDPVLHAVKGWRVAEQSLKKPRNSQNLSSVTKNPCRNRYQESQVRVYSRFRVDDIMTGMRAYLGGLGRQIQCDVTSLAKNSLRVADDRIAYIHVTAAGKVIAQGIRTGRTEVQFLSPFSRVPYGATELEVTNDKVSIRKFQAFPLAKLEYSIAPHPALRDNYALQIHRVRTFSKQYQNGVAKLTLEYSDGMKTDLHDLPMSDFHLQVQANDNNVIFLPPDGLKLALFRYLILDETRRSSVRISFFVPEYCFDKDELPLFTTSAVIESNAAATMHVWYGNSAAASTRNSEEPIKRDGYFANHFVRVVVPTEPQNNEATSEETRTILSEPAKKNLRSGGGGIHGGTDPDYRYSLVLNHSSGAKPTEIILYILVAVSLLVGIIFSLNCFMHSRHAKLKSLKPTCLRLPFPLLPSFIFPRHLGRASDDRETVMPAGQEFIWMRANTLTRDVTTGGKSSVPGCTDRLNNDSYESNDFDDDDDQVCDFSANSFQERASRSSARSTPVAVACSPMGGHCQAVRGTAYGSRAFERSSLYLGSEVSVHICPNPVLEVHCDQERRAASWNFSKSFPSHHHRCIITDSSSEQNISYASTAPRSAPTRQYESHWDSRSLGMNETQLRDYFNSLRETVA